MSSPKEVEKKEFKWLGLESVAEELESLSLEDEFFIWALHRRMEIDQIACEVTVNNPVETELCGHMRRSDCY